jgi:hypothetical protein
MEGWTLHDEPTQNVCWRLRSRKGTTRYPSLLKDVDGRAKPGHDG